MKRWLRTTDGQVISFCLIVLLMILLAIGCAMDSCCKTHTYRVVFNDGTTRIIMAKSSSTKGEYIKFWLENDEVLTLSGISEMRRID